MPTIDDRSPWLFLMRATEPPSPAIHHYVVAHGAVEAVERIRQGAAPDRVLREITRTDVDVDPDLRAIDAGLLHLITPDDDDWPFGQLNDLSTRGLGAPLALCVRGDASLTELARTSVTITGARAASAYGEHVAADFSYDLACAGVTVMGGGSYGVEASAHRGALAGEGPTVVVLSCGVDVPYPNANARLLEDIVSRGGMLISEYPPGTPPARHRFMTRSRLLAALSRATVVVEAGARSGALALARMAGELHRPVYGVPGPITSATSTGVNELLRAERAQVVTAVDQINYAAGLR